MLMLCYSYGIHQEETILAYCIRRDIAQLLITNCPYTTAFHLCVKWQGCNIAHENQYFEWLYIRACRNQRASNGYTEILIVAELPYQFIAISGRISYLLNKTVIIAAEYFFCYIDNVGGMIFIQGKNQRLRQIVHI